MSVEMAALPAVAQRVELERIIASAKDRSPGDLMRELWRFADIAGDDACEALLASNPDIFKHVPVLSKVYSEYAIGDNFEEATRILQGARREDHPADDIFRNIDFEACGRMVMVGCGPCPWTVLSVCDRTDVPEIVALDVRPDAIEMARALLRHFGISRVRAEVCGGQQFDYAGTDVIFVANVVSPKAAVLSRIADTAPATVQIAVREPYSLGLLWTECAESSMDSRLEVVGRGLPSHIRSRNIYIRRRVHGH